MLGNLTATLGDLGALLTLGKHLKPRPDDTVDSLGLRLEQTAARVPDHSALVFEGRNLSWRELNEATNRLAHALQGLGLRRGDSAGLLMENRIEFVTCLLALGKLGVAASLVNTNLTGRSLHHCLTITGSKALIVGEERVDAVAGLLADDIDLGQQLLFVADGGERDCPRWAEDLGALAARAPDHNPPDTGTVTIAERALYLFTSGTTGLPKASIVSHRKVLLSAATGAFGGLRCDERDCIYLCLPLYHGTGLYLGIGTAINTGAGVFLRRRFSASAFLPEVREHGTTCMVYIGELCRYLLALPEQEDDHVSPLTTVMGNGLRPDIWLAFKQRFGIARVSEFYGSSEGNIAFLNAFNRDCTVGTTTLPHALAAYDVDADKLLRDDNGRCRRVANGETGLLLGEVTTKTPFEGYTSREASEAKILRDVFKDGDAWFNTGDLVRRVDVGFTLGFPHYQFVDRVGDTFRWKGENVSTNEVGELLNGHPQVSVCNVYGVEVPGTTGRAGMAAILLSEGCGSLDLDSFSALVQDTLPPYARPLFLRILPDMATTGTFKLLKGDLRKQGYDPAQVVDPLYVLKPGNDRYQPLDDAFAAAIATGSAGY